MTEDTSRTARLTTAAEERHEAWRKIAGLAVHSREALTGVPDLSAPGLHSKQVEPNWRVTYTTGTHRYVAEQEPREYDYTLQEREALAYVASVELMPLWRRPG